MESSSSYDISIIAAPTVRHPFRGRLPVHVLEIVEPTAKPPSVRDVIVKHWKQFLAAYSLTFIAISIFVA